MSNMVDKDDDDTYSDDYKILPGFHLGAEYNHRLQQNISIRPSALLGTKGYSYEYELFGDDYDMRAMIFYLDFFIPAFYTYQLDSDMSIDFGFGPYFGFGLFGNVKSDDETDDIEWGDESGEMKRLDAGLTLGAGLNINNLSFDIAYDLGLANTSNHDENGYKSMHRVIRISAGINLD